MPGRRPLVGLFAAATLCAGLSAAWPSAYAGVVADQTPALEDPESGGVAPRVQRYCPEAQVDQTGELVERCTAGGGEPDYAVQVYESPFEGRDTGWLVSHELVDALGSLDVVAVYGSSVAITRRLIEALDREMRYGEEAVADEFRDIEATVTKGYLGYILATFALALVIFGGAIAYVLVRRMRARSRRLHAARRAAASVMGELVTIRDLLRGLELDTRPGRLEELEAAAAKQDAYGRNRGGLRLVEPGLAKLVSGFYRELRLLPEPYVEERAGRLGTHRVLRLDAADEFAHQAESLASRANGLADSLRRWLDANMARK